jgi:acylglycerol lipase
MFNNYNQSVRFYESDDGVKLAYRLFEPKGDIKGNLVLIHGSTLNSSLYLPIGIRLANDYNIQTFLLDIRGHGQSGGKNGHVDYIGQLVDDLHILLKKIKNEHPSIPLYLCAHSAGASILFNYIYKNNKEYKILIDGYTFISPIILDKDARSISEGFTNIIKINYLNFVLLTFLNQLKIKMFNDISCIRFNYPSNQVIKNIKQGIGYSYNMCTETMVNKKAIGNMSIDKPALTIISKKDQLISEEYIKNSMRKYVVSSDKMTYVEAERDHFSIIFEAANFIGPWLQKIKNKIN